VFKKIILFLSCIACIGIGKAFAQIDFLYSGGSGGGYDTTQISKLTCSTIINYNLLFYAGGSGGNYDTTQISNMNCVFTPLDELILYTGGSGRNYDTTQISKTTCVFIPLDELILYTGGSGRNYDRAQLTNNNCIYTPLSELIIYAGGSGRNYDTTQLSNKVCVFSSGNNIYMGSGISVGSTMNYNNLNNINNLSGPYINTIKDTTIVKGECITLTTTGVGATSFLWTQSVGSDLSSTTIQNPIAKPNSTTTYIVTATGNALGCKNVSNVTVTVIDNGVTQLNYPSSICNSTYTNQYQYPLLSGITNGIFTISPSTGMLIDPKSGAIKTYNATVQTYTITYTYGTNCSYSVTSTVEITENCGNNVGVINYFNAYSGGTSSNVISVGTLSTTTCPINIDYNNLIYSGGTSANIVSIGSLSNSTCPINFDIVSTIFVGGLSNNVTSVGTLATTTCPVNIDFASLLYTGGLSNNSVPSNSLQLKACPYSLGDNFYLGGTGGGYGYNSVTPSPNPISGTNVTISPTEITICPGTPITLTASGATNYSWSPASNLSSAIIYNPVASPITTTTYTVLGTGAGVGCINTAKIKVTVLEDNFTRVSYGAYNFDENDMGLKKVNYIIGPLTGSFSASPTGLSLDQTSGSFIPGLSTSGLYAINYNYTKGACNYSYVSNVNITTLPPSITYPSPSIFYINYAGITVSPTNTGGRAIAYEVLDALPLGLTINASSGVISGTPTVHVENASIRVRAYNYTKYGVINYSEVYTMSISVRKPIISTTTSSISSMNTVYGTPSETRAINVSGQYIIQNILVTPPNGFEVSSNASTGFANTLTLSASDGNIASTNAFIRLKTSAGVGNYSSTVVLTSDVADMISIPVVTSYVAAAPLTITSTYFQKFYGSKIILGVGSKNFIATGLVNGETIGSVTLNATSGTAANDAAGLYNVTPSAATGGTFSTSNYNLVYTPGQFEVLYSLYNFAMTGNSSNWVLGKVPAPKISGMLVNNITYNSATVSATLSSSFSNITRRGVCWSISVNPTITDNILDDATATSGSYSLNITGLTPLTNYFARAYVVIGNTTYYSNNFKFSTPQKPLNSISLTTSSQYLSFPRASSMIAAGDFTYETFIKFNTIGAGTMDPIFGGGQGDYFSIYGGSISARIDVNNPCVADRSFGSSSLISLNNWHHMAMVRSGSTITVYLNGNAIGTTSCTGSFLNSSGVATIMIGKNYWRPGNLNASITNMRLVVGTALYTANFSPPSSILTSIPGTQFLLTFDDANNPYKDSSPNNVTISAFGSPVFNIAGGPF
jgi:hypothetical protein